MRDSGVEVRVLPQVDLDLARRQPGVRPAHPFAHQTADGDDVLPAQPACGLDRGSVDVLEVEDDLCEPVAVAQVDEDETLALVAIGVDPASEGDGLADVARPKLAAHVRALEHMAGRILYDRARIRTNPHSLNRKEIERGGPRRGNGN